MFSSVVNLINNAFQPPAIQQVQTIAKPALQENPFATPFINVQSKQQLSYGKNAPALGGYFAGYHNGKANIVGKKLFINV